MGRAWRVARAATLVGVYVALLYGVYSEAGPYTTGLLFLLLLRLETAETLVDRVRGGVRDTAEIGAHLARVCDRHLDMTREVDQRVQAIEASLDRASELN